jgi:hypothetical protein
MSFILCETNLFSHNLYFNDSYKYEDYFTETFLNLLPLILESCLNYYYNNYYYHYYYYYYY